MIDIIVPVFNELEKTKLFVDSLKKQQEPYNLIIIDNGSNDKTKAYLQEIKAHLITNKENLGYVKATNQGLRASTSEFILLANNDIIITPLLLTSLKKALNIFQIVGPLSNNVNANSTNPLLINYEYKNYEELIKFSDKLQTDNKGVYVEIEHVYGHCMMFSKSTFEKIGYLDERFGIGNYDDLDYCFRAIRKGFKIGLVKEAFVYHFCHSTFKSMNINVDELIKKNAEVFNKKWK